MGIDNLLKEVEDALTACHISDPEFTGRVAGVDASIWMYRGGLTPTSCNVQDGIKYAWRVVQLLQGAGIHVVMIFDGEKIAAKAPVHHKRKETRDRQAAKLQSLKDQAAMSSRSSTTDIARLQRTLSFNPRAMKDRFVQYCHKNDVECVIAPYEADAQLASMAIEGSIDFVVTEDSDLIVYGCPYVMYKLDYNGYCLFYDRKYLAEAVGIPIGNEHTFKFNRFRDRCIISGCDYLNSMPGIGLAKAKLIVDEREETGKSYFKSLQVIKAKNKKLESFNLTNYKEGFFRARRTFDHQVIYSCTHKRFQHLKPLIEPLSSSDVEFAGTIPFNIDPVQYILGNLDIKGKGKVVAAKKFIPDSRNYRANSVYNFTPIENRILTIIPTPVDVISRCEKIKTNVYECDECGHISPLKAAMEAHLSVVHGAEDPYECNECKRRFLKKDAMDAHIRTHTGEKPYKCMFCDKTFSRPGILSIHVRTHTGEKPYKCAMCDKVFGKSSVRDVHLRTHTGEKPYKCTECEVFLPLKQPKSPLTNTLRGNAFQV